MKGPGVQHLALLTTGLIETLKKLRKESFKFLTVPHTYYEAVPTRVPGVTEIQAGGGVLGDLTYRERLGVDHECALGVLATVTSRPTPTREPNPSTSWTAR